MTDLHTRIANRWLWRLTAHALFAAYIAAYLLGWDWDAAPHPLNNTPRDLGEGQGKGMGLGHVVQRNNSNREF